MQNININRSLEEVDSNFPNDFEEFKTSVVKEATHVRERETCSLSKSQAELKKKKNKKKNTLMNKH